MFPAAKIGWLLEAFPQARDLDASRTQAAISGFAPSLEEAARAARRQSWSAALQSALAASRR